MSSRPFFITTPIYYANAPLHIGSAFEIIGIDALARFRRLCGDDVFFLTGMDEHGEKNQRAAEARGITPQQHVDEMAANFRTFCQRLQISADDIIRTTEPRHRRVVEAFWRQVQGQGDIYLGEYTGAYCARCECYVRETDLKDGTCPACGERTRLLSEPAFFFRLSRFTEPLRRHFAEHPDFVQPDFRRREMQRIIESGLEDVCISRSSIHWGIPVPGAPGHVVYVWFDALVNYISAIGYGSDPDRFARYWPAALHVVGKDILRWHTILWPAMLMSAGLALPQRVFGHGFIYTRGGKMSKSLGNVVDPQAVAQKYGADALRYALLRETPYENDGCYSEDSLVERYNRDLGNDLGNLVLRVVTMIDRYCHGAVPAPQGDNGPLRTTAERLNAEIPPAMNGLQFSRALEDIWALVHRANEFIEEQKPWAMAKDTAAAARLNKTLYDLAETLRLLSVWLTPFMPATAAAIRAQLSLGDIQGTIPAETRWGLLPAGQHVQRGAPLFPRLGEPAAG